VAKYQVKGAEQFRDRSILLAPTIISLFGYANFADRIYTHHSLPDKHINLPQLLNYFLWVPGFPRTNGGTPFNVSCSPFSVLRFLYITVDQFRWGISELPKIVKQVNKEALKNLTASEQKTIVELLRKASSL